MKRLCVLILITLLSGACAPHGLPDTPKPSASTSNPREPFELGINIHLDTYPRIARARELGATWVRIDINWDGVEPSPGQWNFSAPDQTIQDACEQGLKVYATLAYSPSWASHDGKNISVPDKAAWRRFVSQVAHRYKGQVAVYGIWNEPNLEEFWRGSAEDYVDVLLKPAWEAIKEASPETLVAGPDLAHLYSARLGIQGFLNTLKQRGGDRYLDILSHHIYGADDFSQKLFGFGFGGIVYKPGLLQMLKSAGLEGKPVWITEMGADARSLGEPVQAQLLVRQIRLLKSLGWVQRAFIFQLGDDQDAGANWGLVRSNGSLRQAYFDLRLLEKTD